jgi:hypothetical protein
LGLLIAAFLFSFFVEQELKDAAAMYILEHLLCHISERINILFRFLQYPRERAKRAQDIDEDDSGRDTKDDESYRGDEEEYL